MRNRYPGTCACGARVAAGKGTAGGVWSVRCGRCHAAAAGIDYTPIGNGWGAHRVRYAGRSFDTLFLVRGSYALGDRVNTDFGPGLIVALGYSSLTVWLDTGREMLCGPGELRVAA